MYYMYTYSYSVYDKAVYYKDCICMATHIIIIILLLTGDRLIQLPDYHMFNSKLTDAVYCWACYGSQ